MGCGNYRGMMLLLVSVKKLGKIIRERLKDDIDKQMRNEEAGFRSKRSCTDQITTPRKKKKKKNRANQ